MNEDINTRDMKFVAFSLLVGCAVVGGLFVHSELKKFDELFKELN